MAAKLEQTLDQAVKDGKIPQAVVYATNRDGSQQYHYATGLKNPGVDDEQIQEDDVFMLASQTKLLATISALQVVEKELIGLDEDVSPHLPELGAQPILLGFDENDKPKIQKRKNPITLRSGRIPNVHSWHTHTNIIRCRQLLTHSSGTAYGFLPDIIKYDTQRGRQHPQVSNAPTILERCDMPLIAEPGESWMYSTGQSCSISQSHSTVN